MLLYVFQHLSTFDNKFSLPVYSKVWVFSRYFFSGVLKVALEIMLSQKFAALVALIVFASQGVIGRPQTLHAIDEQLAEDSGNVVSSLKQVLNLGAGGIPA